MPKKRAVKNTGAQSLLVELFTEELPPKSQQRLAEKFRDALAAGLEGVNLLPRPFVANPQCFATPRRLAVLIKGVLNQASDLSGKTSGPLVSAGVEAAKGFARKLGVPVDLLEKIPTSDGEKWLASYMRAGAVLDDVLAQKVEEALKVLPVQKLMRWGNCETLFARPIHGLVMMHGRRIIGGKIWGLESRNYTLGHRFLSSGKIKIPCADQYEAVLEEKGSVIASFAKRKERICAELEKKAADGKTVSDDALLDEVTALVEWPVVYSGAFDKSFLELPQECLELSMKQHQRYFPLADKAGKLLPRFLMVSNLQTASPENIIHGNERVLNARLSDAKFFYDQDRKSLLEERVPLLAQVVYHSKLGSQLERTERVQLIAGRIARDLKTDVALSERAAWLAKADLLTEMVGEFPELQGVMGRYYALHDGEPKTVADAIEAHYRPRFAGDRLPDGLVACAVALADKLDSMAGLFGIDQVPTGEKDPFGLRRAALGVVRILIERDLPLSLQELINAAFASYNGRVGDAHTDLQLFIFERLAGYLKERGYSPLEVASVVDRHQVAINQTLRVIEAVHAFNALPEAQSLAAANKRVVNILKQAGARGESFANAKESLLQEPAEKALFDALKTTSEQADSLFKQGDFTGYLKTFAILKSPVDAFFDRVMVMVDSPELRHNRLALLADLREKMNRIADISKLAIEK
ncbi:MAG TPA: glycine--tRNA ligase subunit beta [Burkholderiales bacterium]|nr:glycine--tRNA ligase subunit beta [Burkholderiales bacterium]